MKRAHLNKVIIVGITMLMVTNMYSIPVHANWVKDSKDNWNWIDNKVKAVGWKLIDKIWYFFNDDGTMQIGWKLINGKWYHFDTDGSMSVGWINENNNWYFTDSNGAMQTGNLSIEGKNYTFSDLGVMLNNNQENQINTTNEVSNTYPLTGYVSTNSDTLNVRDDATTSSNIIGTLESGAEVKIIDNKKDGFYPITLNGKRGWVSADWISLKASDDGSNSAIVKSAIMSLDSSTNMNPPPAINMSVTKANISLGSMRTIQPTLDNKYYYSDGNLFYKVKLSPPFYSGSKAITGNCTWYAWGRAWEITGIKPEDAGFIGNAYEWWAANKKSGKYQYGSDPRVGAIAVWKSDLPGSEGCGHVAVVEKIENNKVYISESTWHGTAFAYREIYDINYLYGYIYLDKPIY